METYEVFVNVLRSRVNIDQDTVILGASLAYSWMPRILTLNLEGVERSARILEAVKRGGEPSVEDLERLKQTINNSLVGTSKLLHFIAPDRFPIWDSRVCRFLGWSAQRMGDVSTYQGYRALCLAVTEMPAFADIQARLERQLEPMGRLRAVELLMYLGGAPKGK